MEAFLNFLRVLDSFGITYNFRYRDRKKYQTAMGGFVFILFLIFVIVFVILNFIPFVKRKNYTIVYYTMNLAQTQEVSIFESESNFAIGLSCEKSKGEKRDIFDLLDLTSNYVSYHKFNNGSYVKFPKVLITHKCTYKDFYNKYDNEFDFLSLSNFECVDNKEDTIQGIYSNKIFSYFEFSVLAKNKSDELLDEIERYLFNNDCKLNFAYTDIIIDLDNYKSPITEYLNQIFIQLNPALFIKRNIYYMNQYFTTDDDLMYIYGDLIPEIKPLYSRYEEYSLYQGLNRKQTKPPKFEFFSKIYLRADLKKTIIKRKYQRLMEFYASTSCLLNAIYKILVLFFNYIDNFYGFHSISKFIFFFKDLEDEKNFNISTKTNMIKEIISITNSSLNLNNDKDSKFSKTKMNANPKKKEIIKPKVLDNDSIEEDIKEINLYTNEKKQEINKNGRNNPIKTLTFLTGETLEEKEDNNEKDNNYYQVNVQKNKLFQKKKKMNSRIRVNVINNNINLYSSEKRGTNNDKTLNDSNEIKKTEKNGQINNSFNIFELFITQCLKCFSTHNMTIKNNVNSKAKKIIFKNLDIITYIRNNILFNKMNQTLLDDKGKILMNFLSRPIISADNNVKNDFEKLYDNYEDKDFDNYYEHTMELANKSKKEEKDMKLLSISNEHLNVFS